MPTDDCNTESGTVLANKDKQTISTGDVLRTLTLGSIAASALTSSHLINSPDTHYSVCKTREIVAAVA